MREAHRVSKSIMFYVVFVSFLNGPAKEARGMRRVRGKFCTSVVFDFIANGLRRIP